MKLNVDCPFATADRIVEEFREKTDAILVEIHAETTAEKVAFGWHMDGKVAAVLGTHTHIPTADERILPAGTAYQTDVGMTGPRHSVIGRQVESCVGRFLDGFSGGR
jgi:calcineurin-like phosphoesterase